MIPRPMKPTSIILFFLIPVRLGVHCLHRVPPEAFNGGCPRLVLTANPAAIADLVEMSKQEGIIDFAGARLAAAGIVGELDMRNTHEMLLHRSRYIALHYLHVVDIVLNEQIVR